jgi:hypothetical protein
MEPHASPLRAAGTGQAEALAEAEGECLGDAEARQRKSERNSQRLAELDKQYVNQFAACIRELFPSCPPDIEQTIASHACQKYSGRVGRSAAAKGLDEEAIRLAVIAHLRHTATNYDDLLSRGCERTEARQCVVPAIERVLTNWANNCTST